MAPTDPSRPRPLDAARWERIERLFHAAADLDAAAQAAFLAAECGDDSGLLADVTRMLAQDAASGSLLDRDRADLATRLLIPPSDALSAARFGPYRILRLLGEGGSGVVYLAERGDLGNQVAIKFLRDAWMSPARRDRFAVEQRTLAQLNHPSIARLYDAGTLDDSTPWFVMEYVDGVSISEYCVQPGVPLKARLRLFRIVCEAVAYAHERGIIHRDLKPSNILVKPDGTVRLLDFGIAKQVDGTGGVDNHTQTGLRLLTPAYASPEQIRGGHANASDDVYALGVILYQLVAGSLPFDLSALTPGQALTHLLEHKVGPPTIGRARWPDLDVLCLTAMHRDPERRYRTVESLIRDIDHLLAAEPLDARPDALWYSVLTFARRRRRAIAVAALVLAAIGAAWVAGRTVSPPAAGTAASAPVNRRTVAVMPFQNATADADLDFLRFALPDEIATILSHIRSVSVRPFATTSQYDASNLDLQQAGRDMRASTVVTGHFLRAGETLQITLEAIDVETNASLWRDKLDVPAGNLVATQTQIGLRVQGGLSAALGWPASDAVAAPKNEQAYDLFLRTAAVKLDPSDNTPAIRMLERSVALDPTYPPAWVALARRYYVDSRYGSGRVATMARYEAAMARALALDPEYIAAASGLALARTEQGDLPTAYTQALDLVRRRPDSMDAHFILSYVLRYAGLLDEAARECETAFLLDPRTRTSGLRSCAYVFLFKGDYDRAMTYLDLDHGSDFAKAVSIDILVRQGKAPQALELGSPNMPQWNSYDLLLACLARRPASEIQARAAAVKQSEDPETNFMSAAHLAYCGQTPQAMESLHAAIKGKYCGYPALDTDPFFSGLRSLPQFASVRTAAVACQRDFVAHRP